MLKAIFAAGLLLYLLKLTGLCFSAPGYISDRELILAALRHEMGREESSHPPAPKDATGYLRDNPTCCQVHRWNHSFLSGHLLNSLFGRRFFAVDVTYPVAAEAGYEDPFYNAIHIMDCCGIYVPDRYGIGRDTPLTAGPPPQMPPGKLMRTASGG